MTVLTASLYDLDAFTQPIAPTRACAQTWFDHVSVWTNASETNAFDHDEAVQYFQNAVDAYSTCAMADRSVLRRWSGGAAYPLKSNYTKPWKFFDHFEMQKYRDPKPCGDSASRLAWPSFDQRASLALPSRPRPIDRSTERYSIWDCRSISATRNVHDQYPDGFDIATLFADVLMHTRAQPLSLCNRERTSTRRSNSNQPGTVQPRAAPSP